jgi:hypothetical protein
VALFATERLPQPLAVTAPVTVDFANMALVVRRPDAAGGSEKLLWREAHQALVKAERGWPGGTRFVWGSALGHSEFGHAAPGPNLTLVFPFVVGTPAAKVYAELVDRPGLYAIVTADKSARHFLTVRFLNRGV